MPLVVTRKQELCTGEKSSSAQKKNEILITALAVKKDLFGWIRYLLEKHSRTFRTDATRTEHGRNCVRKNITVTRGGPFFRLLNFVRNLIFGGSKPPRGSLKPGPDQPGLFQLNIGSTGSKKSSLFTTFII